MSYNNNQNNDTRSPQLDPAGEPVTLIQNNCYSSAAPTVQLLDTTVATITFNSNLEDITIPRLQMTNLICTSNPNVFNKPQDFNNPITGAIEQQVIMENIISLDAQSIDFRNIGDNGALGGVVIKRMTDGLYWNWHASQNPSSGIPEWGATFSNTGGTFNNGPIDWTVNFEAVAVDTEYQVWCAPVMYTNTVESDYTDNLPAGPNHIGVQSPPSDAWKIFQVGEVTMTANFLDGQLLGTSVSGPTDLICDKGADDTYTAPAGGIFPTPATNGVFNVDISFSIDQEPGRLVWNADRLGVGNGSGGANDDVVTIDNIQLPTTGALPEILSIDCVASIVAESGNPKSAKILGTITFGDIGLVDQDIIFPPSEFFAIQAGS